MSVGNGWLRMEHFDCCTSTSAAQYENTLHYISITLQVNKTFMEYYFLN